MIGIIRRRPVSLGLFLLAAGGALLLAEEPAPSGNTPVNAPGQKAQPQQEPAADTPTSTSCDAGSGPATQGAARRAKRKRCLVDNFLGHLSEFDAPALGATIHQHFQTQVSNADPHRLMLYEYDFVCGTEQLNYRGQEKLARMVEMLGWGAPAVLIQQTPLCPGLSEARRLSVANCLSANGLADALVRVAIATPQSLPQSGVEAVIINRNLLEQTRSVGTIPETGVQSGNFTPTGGSQTGSGTPNR